MGVAERLGVAVLELDDDWEIDGVADLDGEKEILAVGVLEGIVSSIVEGEAVGEGVLEEVKEREGEGVTVRVGVGDLEIDGVAEGVGV